jgi:hypothetical protein
MDFKKAAPASLSLALLCAACGSSISHGQPSPALTSSPAAVASTSTATTPTRTAIPTAGRPTATPAAPVTFTESFDATPPHWVFVSVDNGQAYVGPALRDGFLVFDLPLTDEWGYALYGGQSYQDVQVQAQFQTRTSGDGAAGLVCHYDEEKGWYEFNVFADQTYELLFGQWLAQGVARYTPLYQGRSTAVRSDENQIGLLCQGNQLSPFINGVALRKWPEQKFALQRGEIGLSASSFADAPYIIAFDWAKVSQP